jgi:4-hydroxybenzoate polyprenyltransferase
MIQNKNKLKEYLQALIMLAILVVVIFVFDLPKNNLIMAGVIFVIAVFFYEVFDKKKDNENTNRRKRTYIGSIILFVFFAIIIFAFDAPKKMYAMIGIITVSNILLYEAFNFGNKNKT